MGDFSGKCEQVTKTLRICSHLLKNSLITNSIFCAVAPYLIILDILLEVNK